jgi:hypothetical protein
VLVISVLRRSEAAPATLAPPVELSMRLDSAPASTSCTRSATSLMAGARNCRTIHPCWQPGRARFNYTIVASGRQAWKLYAWRGRRRVRGREPYRELNEAASPS